MSDQDKTQEPHSNEPNQPVDLSTEATLKVHELLHWIENNRPQFFGGLATVAIVIAGWIVVDRAAHSKELRANAALTDEFVRGPLAAEEEDAGPDASALAALSQQFSGTGAASRALLFSGLTYFENKDYGQAQSTLQEFIDQGGAIDPFVAEQTRYAIGVCHEALGEQAQAQAIYQGLIGSTYPTLAASAQFSMARMKEDEGDLEAAVAFYDGLVDAQDVNLSHWANLASARRAGIYEQRPDLEPETEPVASDLPVFDGPEAVAPMLEALESGSVEAATDEEAGAAVEAPQTADEE